MHKLKTEKYFRVLVFMLMLTTYLQVISYRLPAYLGSHHVWAIIWGISLVLFKPQIFTKKLMLLIGGYALFLWIMLNTFWLNMLTHNAKGLWGEVYEIALGGSIITYFHVSKDYKGLAQITKYVLVFLAVTALMTIVVSMISPVYNRIENSEAYELEIAEKLLQRYGAGYYGTAIAFMAMIPLLVYSFKNELFIKKNKWILFFFIALLIVAVIRMQIFTNIMLLFVFLLISIIRAKNRMVSLFIIGFASIVFSLIPNRVYVDVFYSLSNTFQNSKDISFKLKETAYYFEKEGNVKTTGNAVAGRAERYPMLWKAFSKSPFLGCFFLADITQNDYKPELAHLYWMNKLVVTGILGFMLFFSIIITFMKQERKNIQGSFRFYFTLSLLSILAYGLFKATGGRECWYLFFVISPGMYYLPLLKKKNQAENQQDDSIQ